MPAPAASDEAPPPAAAEAAGEGQEGDATAIDAEIQHEIDLAASLPDFGLAPDFQQLEGWINAEGFSLADLRGKVVLIDFWVEPTSLSLQVGDEAYLTAWARFSDGRLEDVSQLAATGPYDG